MANTITPVNVRVQDYVPSTSRYMNSSIVMWGPRKLMTFTTYKRTPLPVTESDKYTVIPSSMNFRPDLVSQEFYGVPDYWWKIMEANNIWDVFNFRAGLNIRLPANV